MAKTRFFEAKHIKAIDHVTAIDHYVEVQTDSIKKMKDGTLKPAFEKIKILLTELIKTSEIQPKIQDINDLSLVHINELLVYVKKTNKDFYIQLVLQNTIIQGCCQSFIKNSSADKMMQEINANLFLLKQKRVEKIESPQEDVEEIKVQAINISDTFCEKIVELQQEYILLEQAFNSFIAERIAKLKAEAPEILFPEPAEKPDKCTIM